MEDVDEAVEELELEAARAQKKQQEELAAEQEEASKENVKTGFEEQIAQI
jgi:hypothetical protein